MTDTLAAAPEGQLFGALTPNTAGKFYALLEVRAAIPVYLETGRWELPEWYRRRADKGEMYTQRDPTGQDRFPPHLAVRDSSRKQVVRQVRAMEAVEQWQRAFDDLVERIERGEQPDRRRFRRGRKDLERD